METWQVVLLALASGAAAIAAAVMAGLKEIITTWLSRINRRIKKKTYVEQVVKLVRFLELFESIKQLQDVQRALIFHGHNCGGLPTPGKVYNIRAVHGWTTKPGKSDPYDRYNFELTIDSHYMKILEELVKVGSSAQILDQMPSDSKLRAYYEAEGVKSSRLYFLGIIDQELIYLSIASYDLNEIGHNNQTDLQLIVDRMRSVMGED